MNLTVNAEPAGADPDYLPMWRTVALAGSRGAYPYHVEIPARRPREHYTVGTHPYHPEAR